jgi:hypothetical protein
MMRFDGPALPPPPPAKKEGAFGDLESLAVFLACGTCIDPTPKTRTELLEEWEAKSPSVRVAYRLRAARLVRAWGQP